MFESTGRTRSESGSELTEHLYTQELADAELQVTLIDRKVKLSLCLSL